MSNSNFNVATNLSHSNLPYSLPHDNMSSLLHIASKVEAAVAGYVLVRDFTDTDKWRRWFDQERVSDSFRLGHSYCIPF